jgi:hypothetical protein
VCGSMLLLLYFTAYESVFAVLYGSPLARPNLARIGTVKP